MELSGKESQIRHPEEKQSWRAQRCVQVQPSRGIVSVDALIPTLTCGWYNICTVFTVLCVSACLHLQAPRCFQISFIITQTSLLFNALRDLHILLIVNHIIFYLSETCPCRQWPLRLYSDIRCLTLDTITRNVERGEGVLIRQRVC